MGERGRVSPAVRWIGCFAAAVSLAFSAPAGAVTATMSDPCGSSLVETDATVAVGQLGNVVVSGVAAPYTAIFGCESPAPAQPSCSLSAAQTRLASGGTTTLYAKCSSGANSFNWNGPTSGPALPTNPTTLFSLPLTFPTPGAYTYSVSGSNGSFGPTSNQLTILVADAATAPICTLTASPVAVATGGKAKLQAVCNPATTAYTWTADTNPNATPPAPPTAAQSGAELTFPSPGTFVYRVQGGSPAGGPVAIAAVTVTGTSTCQPPALEEGLVALPQPNQSANVHLNGNDRMAYSFNINNRTYAQLQFGPSALSYPTPSNIVVVFSTIAGDFNPPANPACMATGASPALNFNTGTYAGYCTFVLGQQYYLNVRHVTGTNTCGQTSSCSGPTCAHQLWSF